MEKIRVEHIFGELEPRTHFAPKETHVILWASALWMMLAGWEEESCSSTKGLATSIRAMW